MTAEPGNAGYSGTPLHRKLGIKHDSRVLVVAAPPQFVIPDLPAGAVVHTRATTTPYDVVVAFCPDARRLQRRLAVLPGRVTTAGALWLAWPKRSSGVATDLDDDAVRAAGLGNRLVDVKVIAVDDTWSALKFVRRARDR